jgi:hypothetical protein
VWIQIVELGRRPELAVGDGALEEVGSKTRGRATKAASAISTCANIRRAGRG